MHGPTVCYNPLCHCQVEFTLSGLSAEELATVQKTLHDIASAFNVEELQGVCVCLLRTQGCMVRAKFGYKRICVW